MTRKVVVASAVRTAVGKMGGTLSTIPAAKLGEIVVREALKRANVSPNEVDMVYMGCVLQAAQGQNVARQVCINSGIPVDTPALTINIVCGSGLESVNLGARLIKSGEADVVIAGGTENMSLAPYALTKGRYGYRMGDAKIIDTMTNDALTDVFNQYHMGITAENVAEQWGISREELDEFSVKSQEKAAKAQAEGRFKDEIVPVEIQQKKATIIFDTDEGIRPGTTVEGLGKLKPAFKKDGIVTAGNSSGINDGAAAVVLMSEEKAKEVLAKAKESGADFAQLAKDNSTDEKTKANGGEITFDSASTELPDVVKKAAFALNVDGISDVITAPGTQAYSNSFYIVKLTKKTEKSSNWEDYKEKLKTVILTQKQNDATFVQGVISKELQAANIKVKDPAFQTIFTQYIQGESSGENSTTTTSN